MITISKSYDFSAAHRLYVPGNTDEENKKLFGKCAGQHGHNYKLTVEVTGRINPETGMILNYFELDKIVKPLIDEDSGLGDHKDLDDTFHHLEGRLTAENLVVDFAELLVNSLPMEVRLTAVTLQETDKTRATWLG